MVDLLDGLATTRAIRRFTADPIPDADLSTILWHATRAPSGSNRQPFRFLVLQDSPAAREAKAALGDAARGFWSAKRASDGYDAGSGTDTASPKARMARAMQRFVDRFEETPVVVLACHERRDRRPDRADGASVYPACQNLLLAARALGYGGVLTGWQSFVEADLRRILAIPDHVWLAGTIALGRPEGATVRSADGPSPRSSSATGGASPRRGRSTPRAPGSPRPDRPRRGELVVSL